MTPAAAIAAARVLVLATGLALASGLAHAQGAPAGATPDSALGGFLDSLSTETDEFFGVSAARPDTAGLDSALAYYLAHPDQIPGRRGFGYTLTPAFYFNRVDGPVYGADMRVGSTRGLARLTGEVGYAVAPKLWLGGAAAEKRWRYPGRVWALTVGGGRETAQLDRALSRSQWRSLRVFLTGQDHTSYYRRDGWMARVERESPTTRFGVTFRDHLESPRRSSATWSLLSNPVSEVDNLQAAFGRVREFEYEAGWRLPWVPITAEVVHQTTGQALGSDFDYRRTRFAISGNFGLRRSLAFVPQIAYGHVQGTAVPQAAFYLGGRQMLRSVPSASVIGSRLAFARIELIHTRDLLEALRLPHPAMFPLQGGVFAAMGSVWGPDPFGGPSIPGDLWPEGTDVWLSEVGASLLWQPGFPDPTGFVRLNYAHGLGPISGEWRLTISYSRALDFVRPFRLN